MKQTSWFLTALAPSKALGGPSNIFIWSYAFAESAKLFYMPYVRAFSLSTPTSNLSLSEAAFMWPRDVGECGQEVSTGDVFKWLLQCHLGIGTDLRNIPTAHYANLA